MAVLPGVTCASAVDTARAATTGWRRPKRRLLCALLILTASALSAPTSAQTRPADQTIELQRQELGTAAVPSAAALERIRRALVLQRPTELPGSTASTSLTTCRSWDGRPAIQLLPGLDVVGGLNLFGLVGRTGRQLGPPTHRDMLNQWTPREMQEAGATDVLGIATASAFALVPYAITAITKIAGWLFGDDGDDTPAHPILTESEETRALAGATADSHVLEAGIHQRGRTVALSLVVRADTPPDTARALGARFVRLVKTFASAEPDPEHDVGAGDYDYIVRVSSPTESLIALGGKATTDTRIHW